MRTSAHSFKMRSPSVKYILKKYANKVGCQQQQQQKSFIPEQTGLRTSTAASVHAGFVSD